MVGLVYFFILVGLEQGGSVAEENNLNGCFRRRGNERMRGDRRGSAETKPHRLHHF